MVKLGYELEYTPDLSLCKYEVLGDNDANGLIGRHNAFLRQWNRITSLTKTRIHLVIQYHANNQPGERMKFLLLITSSSDAVLPALHQLVRVSPLADYFHFVPVDWNSLEHQLAWNYCSEAVLKKTERRRNSDVTSEANSQNFYVVSGWKSAEDARLRDMLRVMDALQQNLAYVVSFEGTDAVDAVLHAY